MGWSGGNYTKGNNATGGWTGDASLGIGIEAGRHDTQDNDFATGIDQCLNKDGSNAATGNLNLGGFLPTNIGAGTAAAPALCAGNDVNTGIFSAAADQIGIATNGTEQVRIDASGKVGIGTTAPSVNLDIQGTAGQENISRFSADGAGPVLALRKSRNASVGTNTIVQDTDQLGVIYFQGANGTGYSDGAAIVGFVNGTPGASNDMPGGLIFYTTPDGSGSLTERMRITSSGNVGIGIDPTTGFRFAVKGTTTTNAAFTLVVKNSADTDLFNARNDGYITTGVAALSPYNNTTSAGANVVVASDGGLLRSTSSARYKTEIQPYTRGLSDVLALAPKFYKGINDGDTQFAGLIAEDVHDAGLTEFVVYNDKQEPDALAYSNMVALAFKAIQELNAKVEALETRVAELEA